MQHCYKFSLKTPKGALNLLCIHIGTVMNDFLYENEQPYLNLNNNFRIRFVYSIPLKPILYLQEKKQSSPAICFFSFL